MLIDTKSNKILQMKSLFQVLGMEEEIVYMTHICATVLIMEFYAFLAKCIFIKPKLINNLF